MTFTRFQSPDKRKRLEVLWAEQQIQAQLFKRYSQGIDSAIFTSSSTEAVLSVLER
jgi:hypothetical protein